MNYSYRISRVEVKIERLMKKLKKYSNFFLFILGTLIADFLIKNQQYIFSLKSYGYFGALISGMLIPFGWVAIPAFAILFILGKELDFWILTFLAVTGTMTSNFLFICWVKSLLKNMEFLQKVKKWIWLISVKSELRKIIKSKYSPYIVPALASCIFASPLPNQWGITLLALSDYKIWKIFLFFSF